MRPLRNVILAYAVAVISGSITLLVAIIVISRQAGLGLDFTDFRSSDIFEVVLLSAFTSMLLVPSMMLYQAVIAENPTPHTRATIYYFSLPMPLVLFLVGITLPLDFGSIFTVAALLTLCGGMIAGYFTLRYLNRQQNWPEHSMQTEPIQETPAMPHDTE